MKNKKIISLAALALTASLFLGACGGNKEEKTQEKSTALNQIITSLGDKGIETYKGDFIIPIFNYFLLKKFFLSP